MVPFTIRWIAERDIDLLLVEEFASSRGFARWFLDQIGESASWNLQHVWHSEISDRESDVVLEFQDGEGQRLKVWIENKVAAAFQPGQRDAYLDRCQCSLDRGECNKGLVILFAPASYLGTGTHGFHKGVRYESLGTWFSELGGKGERSEFKQDLIRLAIKQAETRKRPPLPHDETIEFWSRYWKRVKELAPQLEMPQPIDTPANQGSIEFFPSHLACDVQLLHRLHSGYVNLQFNDWKEYKPVFAKLYDSMKPPGSVICCGKAGVKALFVRTHVGIGRESDGFEQHAELVDRAILAAAEILDFYVRALPSIAKPPVS